MIDKLNLIPLFDYRGYRYYYRNGAMNNSVRYYRGKLSGLKVEEKTLINSKQFITILEKKLSLI